MIDENEMFINHQTLAKAVEYWLNSHVFQYVEHCRVKTIRRTQNGLHVTFVSARVQVVPPENEQPSQVEATNV